MLHVLRLLLECKSRVSTGGSLEFGQSICNESPRLTPTKLKSSKTQARRNEIINMNAAAEWLIHIVLRLDLELGLELLIAQLTGSSRTISPIVLCCSC